MSSSPKSFARRKKSTGDCKGSKSAQVPGLPFEESFKPKPGCWGGRCHSCDSCPLLTQKRFFWPHTDSGFCGLATQNTAKITLDWLKANLMDHCPRKSDLPAQNYHKNGHWASQGQWILRPSHPKHSQNHPGLAEGQPEGPLVQGNLASQLKRL